MGRHRGEVRPPVKKLLVFLLLLGGGFAALWFALGDESFGRVAEPAAPTVRPQEPAAEKVTVQGQGMDVGIEFRGALQLRPTRLVRDGAIERRIPVYELKCEDSAPVSPGVQRLSRVAVKLFDRGAHVADLTADEAEVALDRDANGRPSMREDKELELRNAVLLGVPDGKLGNLRLELAVVRAQVRDEGLELFTPQPTDPVVLVIDGERGGRLSGRGLRAVLPRGKDERMERVTIDVLSEPEVTTEGTRVTARGAMRYEEDLAAGTATIRVQDDVVLSLTERGADEGQQVVVNGSVLTAWLLRDASAAGAGRPRAAWRMLQMEGAPARATGKDLLATSRVFTVLPGADGRPWLVRGSGGESRAERQGAEGGSFTAAGSMHLVRPGSVLGPMHRSLGFPAWSLRQVQDLELTTFEGRTQARARGADLEAEDGMWVARTGREPGSPVVSRGRGIVHVEQADGPQRVVLDGNRGFLLVRDAVRDTVTLGDADEAHAWRLLRGPQRIEGRGACDLERLADGSTSFRLQSSTPSIAGTMGDGASSFRGATAASGRIAGEDLVSLDATGPDLEATIVRATETVQATGRRILQEDPRNWVLEGGAGEPAQLVRTDGAQPDQRATMRGLRLRVHRHGPRSLGLEAETREGIRPSVQLRDGASSHGPVDLDLEAGRIRLLPFAVAPQAAAAHGLGGVLAPLLDGSALRSAWVLADDAVAIRVAEGPEATIAGSAARLVLALQSLTGSLLGDAATGGLALFTRTEPGGRITVAEAPRVQFGRSEVDRLVMLPNWDTGEARRQPRLVLRDPKGPSRDLRDLAGTCDGEIEVLPDRVEFRGPSRIEGLDAEGAVDPNGLRLVARQLALLRDTGSGAVSKVVAEAIDLDWSRMRARAASMDLDLAATVCTVRDQRGAEVWLPDGRYVRARQVAANYTTLALTLWQHEIQQRREEAQQEPRR